jgi:hypothetical protein
VCLGPSPYVLRSGFALRAPRSRRDHGRAMTAARADSRGGALLAAGWRYFGKEEDATGNGLTMLLAAYGIEEPPLAHCLTGRPALIRAPLQPAREWLTPAVVPTEGIVRGLRLCGVAPRCRALEGSVEDRCATLARAFEESSGRPLLCGPFDRGRLWNRYEGLYSAVPAHFVLILDLDDAGLVTLHDPEGVPFAQRPARQLLIALQDGGRSCLIAVDGRAAMPPRSAILVAALRQTAELRRCHADAPDVSARGLRGLVPMLRSVQHVVGSARMALHAGLAFRGRGATVLAALAAEIGTPPSVGRTLADIAVGSALGLRCLRSDDPAGTSEAIARIADLEDTLDRALAEALDSATDRATPAAARPS